MNNEITGVWLEEHAAVTITTSVQKYRIMDKVRREDAVDKANHEVDRDRCMLTLRNRKERRAGRRL